jgi:hypothetical protein
VQEQFVTVSASGLERLITGLAWGKLSGKEKCLACVLYMSSGREDDDHIFWDSTPHSHFTPPAAAARCMVGLGAACLSGGALLSSAQLTPKHSTVQFRRGQ